MEIIRVVSPMYWPYRDHWAAASSTTVNGLINGGAQINIITGDFIISPFGCWTYSGGTYSTTQTSTKYTMVSVSMKWGAELKASDGQEYDLMYPRFPAEGIEIEDGDTISLEGYLVPGPRWNWGEDENHLRVEKVTLNGKEYDLAANFGPRGGAYGPGGCWGYGNSGYSGRGPGMMGRW